MFRSGAFLALRLTLLMVPGFADAKRKNHKRQTAVVNGLKIDVKRSDNVRKNGRVFPHIVYLSYDNPAFAYAPTAEIRLDTTGIQIIQQFTGCTPLPGLIPANSMMNRDYSYVEIEVTCP